MDPQKAARNVACEECGHTRENHDYSGCLCWINADANNKCPCTVIAIKFVHVKKETRKEG